jgi:zinc/manganese transport system substrate-binding protein
MQISTGIVRSLLGLVAMAFSLSAASKLNIVTSTEDLAALAREVGGDRVNVDSIAKGYQDPHFVEPKPSFLLKLQKADVLVVGAPGYLDASTTCRILEVPTGQITRASGDVHPLGNPHYWLDPANGLRIAKAIQEKLSQMQGADAAYFASRYADFTRRLSAAEKVWDAKMAPYRGRKVVTYHRSWPNFCERFGLVVVDYVEPKPGIPPTPSHTLELIGTMQQQGIRLILVEPYFAIDTPRSIAQKTGGQVAVLLPSVGGEKGVTDYFKLFDYDIDLLVSAFSKGG